MARKAQGIFGTMPPTVRLIAAAGCVGWAAVLFLSCDFPLMPLRKAISPHIELSFAGKQLSNGDSVDFGKAPVNIMPGTLVSCKKRVTYDELSDMLSA